MPDRIQRKRTKGWRMPLGTIYVGRGTVWGNPFVVGQPSGVFHDGGPSPLIPALTLDQSLAFYGEMFTCYGPEMYPHAHDWHKRFRDRIGQHPREAARALLRGHDLACWCAIGTPCHATVLLDIANA